MYVPTYHVCYCGRTRQLFKKGKKGAVFKSIEKGKNREKNAPAYAAERFVLQETFLKLKIHGL